MKKIIALLLILASCVTVLAGCFEPDNGGDEDKTPGGNGNTDPGNTDNTDPGKDEGKQDTVDPNKKSEGVMTYAQYMAAEVESEVTIEAFVQATQSWWDNKITVYLQDGDGAYFVYEMACSEADAAKLTKGVKIQVKGYKTIWEGEVELASGATFTFVDTADTYVAPVTDVTDLLGTEELIDHQNKFVKFTAMTIKSIEYKGGTPGDDIYVTLTKGGADYSFCVERYLTGPDTEVYKAFASLKAGDVVDIEGFLYWYINVNTHITSVKTTVDANKKSEGVMTYDEYMAAELESEVTIEAFVQATQSWWDNKITVYLQDGDGAYFVYEMACSEADAAKLTKGVKIQVKGYKTIWEGEVELASGATFTFVDTTDTYAAPVTDVTDLLGTEELVDYQNMFVSFKGMTVKYIEYKGGTPGDDIYVTLTKGGADYSFCVERYLTGPDTELYKAFADIKAGSVIDIEGFLYWYINANTHITSVSVVFDPSEKSEGVMTYDEYMAAELESEVTIEAFVQATQSWWDNKITVYLQDGDGAYFVYEMACSEEDAAKLTKGVKIQVKGYKTIWEGEVELASGATFTFVDTADTYVAPATDVTDLLGTEELVDYQNQYVKFTDMTIKSIEYKGGTPGDDIYVTLTKGGADYSFCVERYLTGPDTEVYKAFASLKAGDVVDIEGFLYWYINANTHITSVTKK